MSEIQSTRHAPTFTAITTFMPPQQSQSGVASALVPLDLLAGLAGGAAGISSPGERYVALMQSVPAQLARTEQATDPLDAASGISKNAHLYATEFTREKVRVTQQLNYEWAIRDFETQTTSAWATRRSSTTEEASSASSRRLIEQLRSVTSRLGGSFCN